MSSHVRTLALAPAASSRRGWLGFFLSVLCFLHCLGAAAFVPLVPSAVSLLTENEALEWVLLGISATLAARACWAGRRVFQRRTLLWAASTGAGIAGLLLEREGLLQVALASLALLQLWHLVTRSRRCLA